MGREGFMTGAATPEHLSLPAYPTNPNHDFVFYEHLRRLANPEASLRHQLVFGLSLDGELDTENLNHCLNQIIQRHSILRAGFRPVIRSASGFELAGWTQVSSFLRAGSLKVSLFFEARVSSDVHLDVPVIDLEGYDESEQLRQTNHVVEELNRTSFDLASGPLLAARLLRNSANNHKLILCASHFVFDGPSGRILRRELSTLYKGSAQFVESSDLVPLEFQYLDYVARQRERLQMGRHKELLDYWSDQYKGVTAPPLKTLQFLEPNDRADADEAIYDRIKLGPAFSARIRALAMSSKTTLYGIFLSAVAIMLNAHTRSAWITVGAHFSNRIERGTERLIGDFSSSQVLPLYVTATHSCSDLLSRAMKTISGALLHQDLSGHVLNSRNEILSEVFQPFVTCEFNAASKPVSSVTGVKISTLRLPGNRSNIPIRTALLQDENGSLEIGVGTFVRLFPPPTARLLNQNIYRIMEQLVEGVDVPVGNIQIA